MTIHRHRTMHRGIALSLHGIIVIYSSHRLETNSSTQTSMERECTAWPYPDHEKKPFWHVLMIFLRNMLFNQGFALVRIRLADAILCHMHYLSNTQITSNDGRFCIKARTINIHLVSLYEGFKSMPNDCELLCLPLKISFVFKGLSSNSRIIHSYGDITITGEGLQIFVLYMLGTHGHWAVRVRDTHTYCRAFSSGAVTTCFYDLVLSRLNFEHPTFRLQGERSNPLRHPRGV